MVEKTGFSKVDANKALEAVISSIVETLQKKEEVRLVGFGTFTVSYRSESTSRNPRDREQVIEIPAYYQPKFRPGKVLKDVVNNRVS